MDEFHVLVCDPLDQAGTELLRQKLHVEVRPEIKPQELIQIIGRYQGLIVRSRTKLPAEMLAKAENLRIIARAGVGVDHIDLETAKNMGIVVVNTPGASTVGVAEHTLALILALARSIPPANTTLKNGQWAKKNFMGMELSGKVLGIIGVGRIGQAVAARAHPFGLRLLGYDPLVSEQILQKHHIEPVSLNEIFTRSDIITLHTPLTETTYRMVDSPAIKKMKPGVLLISTARGGIIDEAALLQGLNSGQVGGAALDVFENEPPGKTSLISHPNLIATPHIAAQTKGAQVQASIHAAEEILRFIQGLPLRWQIV